MDAGCYRVHKCVCDSGLSGVHDCTRLDSVSSVACCELTREQVTFITTTFKMKPPWWTSGETHGPGGYARHNTLSQASGRNWIRSCQHKSIGHTSRCSGRGKQSFRLQPGRCFTVRGIRCVCDTVAHRACRLPIPKFPSTVRNVVWDPQDSGVFVALDPAHKLAVTFAYSADTIKGPVVNQVG